jgi:streptomycin 6-kinase
VRVLPSIPEGLARATIALRGAADRDWLDRLQALIAEFGERWSLEVGPSLPELSFNYAVPALRADGTAAVLKLSYLEDAGFHKEAEALRIFEGRGAARLLEVDKGRGAMVLERLEPGVPLTTVRDDEETTFITANVMRQLWWPVPRDHLFPSILDWARGFERLRRSFGGGTGPMPAAFVEGAEELGEEILASQGEPALLLDGLHHYSVLAASQPTTRRRCCTTPWRCWERPDPTRA